MTLDLNDLLEAVDKQPGILMSQLYDDFGLRTNWDTPIQNTMNEFKSRIEMRIVPMGRTLQFALYPINRSVNHELNDS